ncbi:hypothetical protein BGW38_003792 [Lunasporangiospora selenospora]|uniref:SAC domain-containing protein n=1 Tax=Lunasporangiospora selenospora TaxID=979761 RepID=A0A9P6FQJ8_9FUNG|nr:hypothetical protein BGW38_003792 [Lunasporangiospora selenospora]
MRLKTTGSSVKGKGNPSAAEQELQQQQELPLPAPLWPYRYIQLTVDQDRFVLQPYCKNDLAATVASGDTGAHNDGASEDPLQILFTLNGTTQATADSSQDNPQPPSEATETDVSTVNTPARPQVTCGRVSFVKPGTYTRTESARDYLIYGCIGLLDLHTGPHMIAITSIRALGDIEDTPVFAIDKIAVVPLDIGGAISALDRLAGPISFDSEGKQQTYHQNDQGSGQLSDVTQPKAPVLASDTAILSVAASGDIVVPKGNVEGNPVGSRSPKIKFSFLGIKQETSSQKSSSSSSLLSTSPAPSDPLDRKTSSSSPTPKKVSFDFPRLGFGNRSNTNLTSASGVVPPNTSQSTPSSPPMSPTTQAKFNFFAKLKESILDTKKSTNDNQDRNLPSSSSENVHEESKGTEKATGGDQCGVGASVIADKTAVSTGLEQVPAPEEADSSTGKEFEAKQSADNNICTGVQPLSEDEAFKNKALDRRIIREMSSLFTAGFYLSYELDLLTSAQKRSDQDRDLSTRGQRHWQKVDRRFWWNEHLIQEFLNVQAHGYILPIMQGYVEIEPCVIEEQAFEFILISRRSRERSGLRYQRRGIDENGSAANFVETEQILRIVRNDSEHQVSFVQTRGSIPVFWAQSPYRLKPIPIIERTDLENEIGFKKHIDSLLAQYGRQIFISLVEQHGRELIAGAAYTHHVQKLAEPKVKYIEFDFHEECKGMKYENIDRLIKTLEAPIHELGYCWLAPNNTGPTEESESFLRLHEQKGVIRTNCMDCLDRTNVVQSAIGRYILNHQLLRLGIASFPDKGLSVYEDFETVFNNVWANNGDAISREYAGTSALKGDFTRTGKRNLQGMVNDATNSIARMYQNTFKDYFRQAAIDYMLGNTDLNVFKTLQTTAFGTTIVPTPILASPSLSESATPLPTSESDIKAIGARSQIKMAGLLGSENSLGLQGSEDPETVVALPKEEEKRLQQEAWIKVREAAIETSAEIVISPGEVSWKGWTFMCCSNEISSALMSSSSPFSSPQQTPSSDAKKRFVNPNKNRLSFSLAGQGEKSPKAEKCAPVFYDEKVVLLTERALYICTYDYEMEKVLEFWRLALEKMTGIDKGPYFMSAQDKTPRGMDPFENYGFAIVYRTSAGGETLRVNNGSVRNRRMMSFNRSPGGLERVPEVISEADEAEDAEAKMSEKRERPIGTGRGTNSTEERQDQTSEIRSVRFKIVKHPETNEMPFVASKDVDAASTGQDSKQNPGKLRRTAQDWTEWVVTEIVQGRCELVSVAESGSAGRSAKNKTEAIGSSRRHERSPSEEYNYHSPKESKREGVQVDLVINDRVLQSLEAAAELEKHGPKGSMKGKGAKRSKGLFAELFMNASKEGSNSNSVSWIKKLQFGQDTDDDDDDEAKVEDKEGKGKEETKLVLNQGLARDNSNRSSASNNVPTKTSGSKTTVFAKLKQAVKNI